MLVWPPSLEALPAYDAVAAIAVTTLFAGGAWLLRGVTAGGALAGFAIAFAVYVSAGPGVFVALVTVFAVAWVTTRFGTRRKRALGLAEDSRGRSAAQVSANLGVAAALCIVSAATERSWLLGPAMAALAEAAADTAASECGEALADGAFLITSLRPVRAGTDGGVSVPGTLAGLAAASVVAGVAAAVGVIAWPLIPAVAAAGTVGTLVDSVLGATLQARGIIGNNGVNFAGTLTAAAIVLVFAQFL